MNPNKFPKKNSYTSTQKPGSPVESPSADEVNEVNREDDSEIVDDHNENKDQ